MIEITRFLSDDRIKEAVVCFDNGRYFVRFYDGGLLVDEKYLEDRSHHFAEDMAENFVNGILKT